MKLNDPRELTTGMEPAEKLAFQLDCLHLATDMLDALFLQAPKTPAGAELIRQLREYSLSLNDAINL